jgi:hypothetical protein
MLLQFLSYAGLASTVVLYCRLRTRQVFKPAYALGSAN